MIEEFRGEHSDQVNMLGHVLSDTYDVKKRNELEKVLVYTNGDEVLGFIQYVKMYETIEIIYIVVREECRHLGIGSYFLEYLSQDLDVEKLILEVRVSNETAIEFYTYNGFTKVRPIENYYRDGEDALSMMKVIR